MFQIFNLIKLKFSKFLRKTGDWRWGGGQSEDSDSLWLHPQTLCQELLKTPK